MSFPTINFSDELIVIWQLDDVMVWTAVCGLAESEYMLLGPIHSDNFAAVPGQKI